MVRTPIQQANWMVARYGVEGALRNARWVFDLLSEDAKDRPQWEETVRLLKRRVTCSKG